MRKVPYPKPGEILLHEFLEPLGLSAYRLAKDIGVPQMRISEVIAGKRAITVDTGLRLSRYFGLNDGFWTGLQLDYEAAVAKEALADTLAKIKPLRAA
ncbi:MAG: HigA family addiction module antidote protein [Gammaproteobacteria bacterium]|nr:HigA family addiction module antidote protein [Gammaproteobacteria bacterium]